MTARVLITIIEAQGDAGVSAALATINEMVGSTGFTRIEPEQPSAPVGPANDAGPQRMLTGEAAGRLQALAVDLARGQRFGPRDALRAALAAAENDYAYFS